jgi:ribosomal protein S18 acetylase RimI-like enzyme
MPEPDGGSGRSTIAPHLTLRAQVAPEDARRVEQIVRSTGFFREDEVAVAVELVEERLERGEASGYHFLFAEHEARTVGYACFGPIACTLHSWDLYWIAVQEGLRNRGIGRRLLEEVEREVALRGGRRLYIETSAGSTYLRTRRFYEARGYLVEAQLEDFYAPGDSKVILVKAVGATTVSLKGSCSSSI